MNNEELIIMGSFFMKRNNALEAFQRVKKGLFSGIITLGEFKKLDGPGNFPKFARQFKGTLEDQYGSSVIEGTVDENFIYFIKKYSTDSDPEKSEMECRMYANFSAYKIVSGGYSGHWKIKENNEEGIICCSLFDKDDRFKGIF